MAHFGGHLQIFLNGGQSGPPKWPPNGHQIDSTEARKGGAWAWSRLSDFFIIKFEFHIPKLVYVPIFSLIGPFFILGGVGRGRGLGMGFIFFHCQI